MSAYDSITYLGNPATGNDVGEGYATMEVVYRDVDWDVLTDAVADAQAARLAPLYGNGASIREILRWSVPELTYAVQSMPLAKIQAAAGTNENGPLPLKFIEGPYEDKIIPEPGALLLPVSTLQVTLRDWPCVPRDALARLRGKINRQPLGPFPRLDMMVIPPGAALCQPASVRISRRSSRGARLFNITLRFDIRQQNDASETNASWNSFPTPSGVFAKACFGGKAYAYLDTAFIYHSADFRPLFVPGPPLVNFP